MELRDSARSSMGGSRKHAQRDTIDISFGISYLNSARIRFERQVTHFNEGPPQTQLGPLILPSTVLRHPAYHSRPGWRFFDANVRRMGRGWGSRGSARANIGSGLFSPARTLAQRAPVVTPVTGPLGTRKNSGRRPAQLGRMNGCAPVPRVVRFLPGAQVGWVKRSDAPPSAAKP